MDFQQVKELIQLLDKSSLTELHVSIDNSTISLSKNTSCTPPSQAADVSQVTLRIPPNAADEPITILPEPKQEVKAGTIVTSPVVGTFYVSASPDKPAFVKPGDAVKAGQVLCIVEAMKVMNEITAKQDGTIAEILAANEQLVEFNQPLFRIV